MRRPWMIPLVPVYAAGAALRWLGVKPKSLSWPVISIGNLSAGGTGKTPFTIELARLLAQSGLHVDVLSRGYGRAATTVERVDPLGSSGRFGDEPLLIGRETGISVYVGADRFAAGALAEQQARYPGVHLLDDGFQHRQLAREIDIVLLNSEDLSDHLIPAGNLREDLKALPRASVFAVPHDDEAAVARIRQLGLRQPIWRFRREMTIPTVTAPVVPGQVVAFCGIARPRQFFAGLEEAGVSISARHDFRDHHRFTASDVAHLRALLAGSSANAFLTTAKDRVRLGPLASELEQSAPVLIAGLRIVLEDEAAVMEWLLTTLKMGRPNSAL